MSGTQMHHTHTPCQQSFGDTLLRGWVTQNYSGSSRLLSTRSSVIRAVTEHSSAVVTSLGEILLLGWAQGKFEKKETPHFTFENEQLPVKNIKQNPYENGLLITLGRRSWDDSSAASVTVPREGGRAGWLGKQDGWWPRKDAQSCSTSLNMEGTSTSLAPSISKLQILQSLKCLIKMDETQSLMGKVLFLLTWVPLSGETCIPVNGPLLSESFSTSLSSKVTCIFIYKTTEPH